MFFLTPEQANATRQSVRNGDWIQGAHIVTGPLRSSLHRIRRNVIRRRVQPPSPYPTPSNTPIFSNGIYPLYVPMAKDLHMVVGLERLFSDVDKQIRGEFRLAGGAYHKIKFGAADQFTEPEDAHAFDRLYWAARYARAAAFGHPDAIMQLRLSWVKWLIIPHGPVSFAPYTIAERIASLSECLFWMKHCAGDIDTLETQSMKRQIWADAHRLSANIEYGLGVHNHLLNDARGLFRASRVLPEFEEAVAWREQALTLWDKYFPNLILDDGTFAEQSSHYHLLLCRTALEYFLATCLSHHSVPDGLQVQLTGMFHLANDLLRPDGSLPRFGDNSPDQTMEDLWGLMSAAYHYGLLKTRPRHEAITPLTLLYCGEAPRLPAPTSTMRSNDSFYPQGGFMFLRSIDGAVELTVHADPRPGARAHGDSCRGSFELWSHGRMIVREPGSMLSSSNPRSGSSRSGLTHNVTCLNGLAPAVMAEDRKFLPAEYANQGGAWVLRGSSEIGFRWDGFQRIRKGIVLCRTWHLDVRDNVSFEEGIDGSGRRQSFSPVYVLVMGEWKLSCEAIRQGIAQTDAGSISIVRSVLVDLDVPLGVTPDSGARLVSAGVWDRTTNAGISAQRQREAAVAVDDQMAVLGRVT